MRSRRGVILAMYVALSAATVMGVRVALVSASQPNSGVHGRVLYGPTCPVQHIDQDCFRPAGGTIIISREPAHRFIARVESSSHGHFTVRLVPGRYLFVLLAPYTANPSAKTRQVATVRKHRFTNVTLSFDSATR